MGLGGWVKGSSKLGKKRNGEKWGSPGKGGWEKTRLRKLELYFFAGRLSRRAHRTGKGEELELKVAWEKEAS